VLEEALVRERLPYVMFGGMRFFARLEIKDVLAYLRLLVNPADSVAARRIINVPARGIGAATVERIAPLSEAAGGFYPACCQAVADGLLGGAAARRLAEFVALIEDFRARAAQTPFPQLTAELIDASGYGPMLREDDSSEAQDRLENLDQLLAGMEEHDSRLQQVQESASPLERLQDYLEQMALVTDLDAYDPSLDRVTLMTLHAAKGLEFPVVFMTGMEEGLFPAERSGGQDEQIEEERRLCYVGMTRARERLFLTAAGRRRVYGSYQFNPPSRFLAEVPPHLLAGRGSAPLRQPAAHNLASLFEQLPCPGQDEAIALSPVVERPPAPPSPSPRLAAAEPVIEVEAGVAPTLRIGSRVRHARFGVGTVRRREGAGDKQWVFVYCNLHGPKRLLLEFAGLEPA
jgi:DNA helicase-2/ATP-dependent DNA helicase PcrA